MNQSCIFCKIQSGVIQTKKIAENEHVFVIKDIAPKAPIHYLIIAKKHHPDVTHFEETETNAMASFFLMAKQLSQSDQSAQAFTLQVNNGAAVGQSVFHVHMHFLAGKALWQD